MAAFYSCLRGKKSDCGIMASGSADATAAHEPSDVAEECPGKKKSKFQTFKNFFAKKKRKEPAAPVGESGLKSSQSSDDVNTPEPTPTLSDKDSDSGSKINMGNKALSHDSVFASESPCSETNEALRASQDSIHGKVKSLQLQLKQAIRLGSPPAVVSVRKGEDAGALSEDDGLPCSPPEYSTLHTVLATSSQRSSGVVQRTSSLSIEGTDSDDDQLSYGASSRPGTPQASIPVDFSQPASSLSCLDSSAAHHRIAVKAKACAKRKPASREKRNLREIVLLRDTEDKLKALRSSTEEEQNEVDASETVQKVDEPHEDPKSSPALHNAEEQQALSQSQRASTTSAASTETSEDEERLPDADHVPNSKIPESSWESPVTLELQADDFLLDSGCEVVSKEQGSLLEEVLSSLKGPLASSLVLDPEDKPEKMEMEEDMSVTQDEKATIDLPVSTDQGLTLEENALFEQNTLTEESVKHLQEAEEPLEQEEEPEEQELAEEASSEENQQVPEADMEKEESEDEDDHEEAQDENKCVMEEFEEVDEADEVNEEGDTRKEALEEVVGKQEYMDNNNRDYTDEGEDEENEEDVEKVGAEVEQAEVVVVEENSNQEVEEDAEIHEEEKEELVQEQEENETKDEPSPFEDERELEEATNDCTEVKNIHESEESIEDALVSTGTAEGQPEEVPAQLPVERPSFVVTTSLDLSLPNRDSQIDASKQQQEEEEGDKLEIPQQDDTSNQEVNQEGLQEESSEGPQISDDAAEAQEAVTGEPHRPRFTIAPAWQRSLSGGSTKEQFQDIIVSESGDEPIFKASLSVDQSFDAVKAERPSSPCRTQSVPSLPVQRETGQVNEEATPENPFGVRLRKTAILHRYASEGESADTSPITQTEPAEVHKSPVSLDQHARKPVLPKKPDQLVDGGVKPKRTSDVAVSKVSVESSSEPPSWISVARQKQKIFSSLEESPERQEEFNKKGSLPDLSSPVTKDQQKPAASPVKVSCSLEISKPALVEKENKRTISHPNPAPLAQDEPPWLALAKKKAKAWSEMPQIVQ
uniref:Zgc:66433 n=1 Tax=Astyanax mexicanus TaxID=7994 RepID=W5JYJ4_ASTMX